MIFAVFEVQYPTRREKNEYIYKYNIHIIYIIYAYNIYNIYIYIFIIYRGRERIGETKSTKS